LNWPGKVPWISGHMSLALFQNWVSTFWKVLVVYARCGGYKRHNFVPHGGISPASKTERT
jgi:hypothetical protein